MSDDVRVHCHLIKQLFKTKGIQTWTQKPKWWEKFREVAYKSQNKASDIDYMNVEAFNTLLHEMIQHQRIATCHLPMC